MGFAGGGNFIAAATATLIISQTCSNCSNCGKKTRTQAITHDTVFDWEPDHQSACGARFTAITCSFEPLLGDRLQAFLGSIRPDLPIIDYESFRSRDGLG